MRKMFDITKIMRLVAMLTVIFMLGACGNNDKTSTIAINPNSDEVMTAERVEEENRKECWQAAVVGTIYKTTGTVTMEMYDHLCSGALPMMMIAFAVWMSFQVLKHVSSFTEESPAELWTEVMKKFFVCLICGILATTTDGVLFVLNSIIFPIYNAFLEFGSAMISKNIDATPDNWHIPFLGNVPLTTDVCKASPIEKATLSGFPDSPREMMECLTCAVSERLNFGIYLGWKTIELPGVTPAICGAFIVLMFFFVKISFAIYLVDAIFRFAMMVMILPLLIMSFAFKTTSKCAKVGFYAILNSAAFLMMIATVTIMIFVAIQEILNQNMSVFEDERSFSDISVAMVMLLLTGFLAIGSINVAKDICDKLVCAGEGGDANFQKKFGSFIANIGLAVISGGSSAVGKFALRNSKKLRAAKAVTNKMKSSLNNLAGRNKAK